MSTDNKVDKRPRVETRLGTFTITRKGAVAISVVKTKHSVRHHRTSFEKDEITHIEHRKLPKYPGSDTGWYTWVATFGLDGKELNRRKSTKRPD